jgi:hypothetical protein
MFGRIKDQAQSTMKPTPDDLFLDPPHAHDPTKVSKVAALPAAMLTKFPAPIQDTIWALQESTSIVYSSYLRLCILLEERFDRLHISSHIYFRLGIFKL